MPAELTMLSAAGILLAHKEAIQLRQGMAAHVTDRKNTLQRGHCFPQEKNEDELFLIDGMSHLAVKHVSDAKSIFGTK